MVNKDVYILSRLKTYLRATMSYETEQLAETALPPGKSQETGHERHFPGICLCMWPMLYFLEITWNADKLAYNHNFVATSLYPTDYSFGHDW